MGDSESSGRKRGVSSVVHYSGLALGVVNFLLISTVFILCWILAIRPCPTSAPTQQSATVLSLSPASLPGVISISSFGGVSDGTVHSFAGKVTRAIPGVSCDGVQAYGFGCGASLVSVAGLPDRRVVITAGHCVPPATLGNARYVSFDETPAAQLKLDCAGGAQLLRLNMTRWFHVTKAWTAYDGSNNAGLKSDWAVLLLDQEVPSSLVPYPAVIMASNNKNDLTPKQLPVTGMAGYGIYGYGPDGQVSPGQPNPVVGPSIRTYIEMSVNSITASSISNSANLNQGDMTACNGDSGSAAISPTTGAPWQIWGTVTSGDTWCRSSNSFARTDVPEYRAWLQSIQADIVSNA